MTVRHLLTHRSGVPHRVTSALDETLPLHPSDVVARVRTTRLLFEPGSKELYSSAGFTCLARIIELIEGKPFDAALRERVFLPAAMTAASDETGEQLMLQRALPHRLSATSGAVVAASTSYKNLGFFTGAGSVYATAEDVLHFIRASRAGVIGREARQRTTDSVDINWRTWYGRTDGMKCTRWTSALSACIISTVGGVARAQDAPAAKPDSMRSTQLGVYTDVQAKRGAHIPAAL